jgi:regulator of sirC expression with transglutaminase-like and TPR domain
VSGRFGVREPFEESPEFRRLLAQDPGVDLVRIALEIARDAYSDLDPTFYLGKIDNLAGRVRDRCPRGAKPRQVLGQINWVLFVEESYQGNLDDYYDPRNSYLNEVLERKTGIPITLSILYGALAARVGLPLSGVNLPAHFLLRLGCDDSTVFVDPFHYGVLLDRRGCEQRVSEIVGRPVELTDGQLAPCAPELVVARMLRNLKAIYLRTNDFAAALPVQRRLAAVDQRDPAEKRDLGMLCLQLDRPAEAIAPLEAYLSACPEAEDAEPVRALLRASRREVSSWN